MGKKKRKTKHRRKSGSCKKRFPDLFKVACSELQGYNHVKQQFSTPYNLSMMNKKLIIFTAIFTIMAFENIFRILDFRHEWQWPIQKKRNEDLDFDSNADIGETNPRYEKLTRRKNDANGAMFQNLACMLLMLINNLVWIKRDKFSPRWHTLHYFLAALILVLYIPRHDWFKTM